MRRILLLAACALLATAGALRPLQAEEASLRGRWATLRGESLDRLHELAKWCGKAKLFRSRAEVYRGILAVVPDDPVARRKLKYTRDKEGAWVRKSKWREPKNLSKKGPDFIERRTAQGAWFAKQAADLLDEAYGEDEHRVGAAIIKTALALDPEREQFRDWNNELKDGKRGWILRETKNARKRRPGLRKTAKEAIEAMEAPTPGAASKDDRIGKVDWLTIHEGTKARIVSVTAKDEVEQMLRFVETCWPVFKYAVDRTGPTYRPQGRYVSAGLTLYVFDSLPAGNAFYAAQPHTTERRVKFMSPLVGTWLPRRNAILVKSHDQETRYEVASKLVLKSLNRKVLGLDRKRAWAAEGLALYLNYQIVGTRRVYSVNDVKTEYAQPDKPIPEYERKMADSNASWLDLGRMLLESPEKPNIHLMSGKDFNTLTRADVLYGYCVAAYVVEGWPEKAADFFRTVTSERGTDLDNVCFETFGFDATTLETRLHRWLKETEGM